MSWFSYTHTDMNGYLQRGSMFVLSSEQFQLLLPSDLEKVGLIQLKWRGKSYFIEILFS